MNAPHLTIGMKRMRENGRCCRGVLRDDDGWCLTEDDLESEITKAARRMARAATVPGARAEPPGMAPAPSPSRTAETPRDGEGIDERLLEEAP